METRVLLMRIKKAELGHEITREKIKKLQTSDKKTDHLKAEQMKWDLWLAIPTLEAAKKELEFLVNLASEYPNYTEADIEANQDEYWERRLLRQAETDRAALEQGVTAGNLASLLRTDIQKKRLTT